MMRSMNFARLLALSALAGTTLSGCATVASSYPTNSANSPRAAGPVYNLPVKTMSVSVGSNGFGLFVAVHDVRTEGDASAAYVLDYKPDSSSADTFDVGIDPAGLLSTVKVEADSKAAETISALTRSAGQFAGAFESKRSGRTRLYAIRLLNYWPTATTTPDQAAAALAAFNVEINQLVLDVVRVHGCGLKDEAVLAADRRPATCDANGGVIPRSVPTVTLAIDGYRPFHSNAAAPDCSIGICTRQQVAAAMQLSTIGSVDTARVPLPNGSDPVPLPLRRVAFTKATTEYTLVDGLLTKVAFAKGAELPAIFAAPGNLIGSFVGGVVDGVAQAGNLRKARTDAATSKSTAADARKAAAEKGNFESNRPDLTDTAFDASLVMIVYPLPQLGLDVGKPESANEAQPLQNVDQAPALGRTTPPGPISANPIKEKQ